MKNLVTAFMAACAKYDAAQIRADIEYGTVTKADPPPNMNVEVELRSTGLRVSTAKKQLALTEACIWKSITLGHNHGGRVPDDLALGVPPGDRFHPPGQIEAMPKYPGVIHYPYTPYTIQDGLHVGDTVILLRGLKGYQYVCLSRIYDKF